MLNETGRVREWIGKWEGDAFLSLYICISIYLGLYNHFKLFIAKIYPLVTLSKSISMCLVPLVCLLILTVNTTKMPSLYDREMEIKN